MAARRPRAAIHAARCRSGKDTIMRKVLLAVLMWTWTWTTGCAVERAGSRESELMQLIEPAPELRCTFYETGMWCCTYGCCTTCWDDGTCGNYCTYYDYLAEASCDVDSIVEAEPSFQPTADTDSKVDYLDPVTDAAAAACTAQTLGINEPKLLAVCGSCNSDGRCTGSVFYWRR